MTLGEVLQWLLAEGPFERQGWRYGQNDLAGSLGISSSTLRRLANGAPTTLDRNSPASGRRHRGKTLETVFKTFTDSHNCRPGRGRIPHGGLIEALKRQPAPRRGPNRTVITLKQLKHNYNSLATTDAQGKIFPDLIKARAWQIEHPDGSTTVAEMMKVTATTLGELAKRSPEGTILSAGSSLKDLVFWTGIPLKGVFPMEEDFETLAGQVLHVLAISGALADAEAVFSELVRLYRMMNSVAHGYRPTETEAYDYGVAAIDVGQRLLAASKRVPVQWYDGGI